eukprot:TRINITY_DN513_c0_g1_i2.p1 TRINITY_DN513_c0_g1~~TRINITY_DN513_c0_g1_i2.p1  ORF type:complete len:171 (+),score=21.25 TRINITY_DN513_c0_g1_i2:43-555(+)
MSILPRKLRVLEWLLVLHLLISGARGMFEQQEHKEQVKMGLQCAPGCKPLFIGDRNCDPECNTEACQWDGGDCEDKWELRRMLVMGEFYESVHHVEYHAVAPDGIMKQLTMEQGRKWEGIEVGEADAPDWRELVCDNDDKNIEGGTWEGKVWHSDAVHIGRRGLKPTTLF